MSTKDDFTDEEWFLLSTLPPLLGSAVATIDKSGMLGTFKEMSASMRAGMSAVRDHADNELIQAIVHREGSLREAMSDSKEHRQKLIERARDEGATTPERHAAQILGDCTAVADILENKTSPDEARGYKAWACSIAQEVAEAAKEGGFGFGGGSVSEKEMLLLDQIRDALRVNIDA